MAKIRVLSVSMALLALLIAGCGGDPNKSAFAEDGNGSSQPMSAPGATASQTDGSDSRTLEIPGDSKLPEGHPPVGSGSGSGDQGSIRVEAPGSGKALEWTVPNGWESVKPGSSMRYAQYRVPGLGGDGECIVYYFGPGQGGDPQGNAVRWARQFSQPDGSDPVAAMKVEELEGGRVDVLVVSTRVTYSGGMAMMGETKQLTDYALLGGIAKGVDAFWFYKFTGPAVTVDGNRSAFEEMMRSVHVPGPKS